MRCLLDTHVLIWVMENSSRLKPSVREIIDSSENEKLVSVVSVWEMLVKKQAGKLPFSIDVKKDIVRAGFSILPLRLEHVSRVVGLLLHHKDPFDRMLICQAQAEKLTLITADAKMTKYPVDVVSF